MAQIVQDLVPEPGVHADGGRHAPRRRRTRSTGIQRRSSSRIAEHRRVVRIDEPEVVPARTRPLRHRVRLPPPRSPVSGSMTFTHPSASASGDSVVPLGWNFFRSGRRSGQLDPPGAAAMVPSSRWMIGIGSPQYRCREKSQSRSLYCTVPLPRPFVSSHAVIFCLASGVERPFSETSLVVRIDRRPVPGERRGRDVSSRDDFDDREVERLRKLHSHVRRAPGRP